MSVAAVTIKEPDSADKLRQRFIRINQAKLQRVDDSLNSSQQGFLDLLPLLFHVNNPGLPGYVSDDTPAGMSNYMISSTTMKAAAKFIPEYRHDRRARHQFDIYAMFCMGSRFNWRKLGSPGMLVIKLVVVDNADVNPGYFNIQ